MRAIPTGVLFRAEPRHAGFRFCPALATAALVDRVKRLNAGLLVVSTLDALVFGAFTSTDLAGRVARPGGRCG